MMTPKARTLRLDAYVRVSKVGGREGEGFISPSVQADAIQTWADAHGHNLTLHEPELDVSGGTMRRPVFDEVVRRIEAGESDGLVVYKVDRFARSLLGALTTLEGIAKAGGTFASVRDQVDMTTAQGRAFLNMQLVFAELFREQIGEQFDVATRRAVERGVHISNVVPLGYDRVEQRLVPNADATIIQEVFERRAAGEGASEIGRWLDIVKPRDDGGRWPPARVRSILSMRVYVGEAYHGQHRNRDAHPAIVTEALFQRAANAKNPTPATGGTPALLAGIVRCAACRYVMTPAISTAKDRAPTAVYRCRRVHTAGECKSPTVIARERLEDHVERAALELLAQSGHSVEASEPSADMARLQAELEAAQLELDTFAQDTAARSILRDRWHEALQARADAVTAAENALGVALGAAQGPGVTPDDWEALSVEERRLVLSNMLAAVFVRKHPGRPPVEARTFFAWRPWNGEDDLPRRGRDNGSIRPVEWPS